jgi:hypothetical protein
MQSAGHSARMGGMKLHTLLKIGNLNVKGEFEEIN